MLVENSLDTAITGSDKTHQEFISYKHQPKPFSHLVQNHLENVDKLPRKSKLQIAI